MQGDPAASQGALTYRGGCAGQVLGAAGRDRHRHGSCPGRGSGPGGAGGAGAARLPPDRDHTLQPHQGAGRTRREIPHRRDGVCGQPAHLQAALGQCGGVLRAGGSEAHGSARGGADPCQCSAGRRVEEAAESAAAAGGGDGAGQSQAEGVRGEGKGAGAEGAGGGVSGREDQRADSETKRRGDAGVSAGFEAEGGGAGGDCQEGEGHSGQPEL
mmetsp:Transcript_11580/g.25764  ORF Transcript_11580/g.25764 Transcript_11580/m.25764 type:complete len:214 (+) Transcript_11580:1586-2227(+)